MSTIELKSSLHQLIDSFENEEELQRAFDSLLALKGDASPLLDDTSPETLERLRRDKETVTRASLVELIFSESVSTRLTITPKFLAPGFRKPKQVYNFITIC